MIPVMDGHPREKAVVSLRDRWLLCRQRDGSEGREVTPNTLIYTAHYASKPGVCI